MRAFGLLIAALVVLPLAGCSGGNAAKIAGTWEVVKGEKMSAGSTLEFTKDGKVKITLKVGGQTRSAEGTYKVNGDKLTTTGKGPDGKEKTDTFKIKKLTGSELTLEKDGNSVELKKK